MTKSEMEAKINILRNSFFNAAQRNTEEAKRLPSMEAWFEGRASGFQLALEWLDEDFDPKS